MYYVYNLDTIELFAITETMAEAVFMIEHAEDNLFFYDYEG